MPVAEVPCTRLERGQSWHDAKFQEYGYARFAQAGNLDVGPSTPSAPWFRIGRVTDHRLLPGKSVTSLLFGLVGTVLAVASCGSDTDSGKPTNPPTGGASQSVGGSVGVGGSVSPGNG